MTILVLCFIAAVIMFFMAPIEYSLQYSMIGLVVFLLSSWTVLRNNCRKTFVKFEFFFIVAFFFSNIIYSVFYYPVNPYFLLFNFEFNENYINKGLGLSLVAITAFNLGVYDKYIKGISFDKSRLPAIRFKEPKNIAYILFLIYIPYVYSFLDASEYVTEFTSSNLNALLVFILYYLFFAIFYNNKNENKLLGFVKNSNSILLFCALGIYILLYLIIGSRSIPITIILFIFFCYNSFIKSIENKYVILLICVGAVLMMAVSFFRARGQMSADNFTSVLDIGMDLTINNRSLYVLMEHADNNGINFGRTMILSILAMIPFAQGIFVKLSGMRLADLTSAQLTTALYYDNVRTDGDIVGLGTNIVGDIYVAFGFVGVIFFMYMLGHILKKLNRKVLSGDYIALFVYALIFIDVVFMTRGSVLEFLRNIVWGLLWMLVFNGSIKRFPNGQKGFANN